MADELTTMLSTAKLYIVTLVCVIPAIVITALAVAKDEVLQEDFDSPRLAALAKQLTGEGACDHAIISSFWEERQGNGPLLEPIADDSQSSWITFLWRGDNKTERVSVQGGPGTAEAAGWMKPLATTNLWYRTARIPNDARFAYFFQVNRPLKVSSSADNLPTLAPPKPDPLNPKMLSTRDASLMELPAAPPQPWLEKLPGVPKGELSKHSLKSEILKQERTFTIYTPPNYDPDGEAYRLLVLFDGEDFQRSEQIPGPVILDNLISDKKIPPFLAVLINQIDRDKELTCAEPFADFVAKELVPWVNKHYPVSAGPTNTIVGGSSFGGLMAAYCALRHSELFGNVLSLSGAYQWFPGTDDQPGPRDLEPGWLTGQFLTARRLPVRFYLAAGRFEHRYPVSLRAENRRFRDVLRAKNYLVNYVEFSGGHDPICWRSPFVEGLTALAGTQQDK